jgi:hypothetical protein
LYSTLQIKYTERTEDALNIQDLFTVDTLDLETFKKRALSDALNFSPIGTLLLEYESEGCMYGFYAV